eukprot:759579-Hanusia_phi.AAC.5
MQAAVFKVVNEEAPTSSKSRGSAIMQSTEGALAVDLVRTHSPTSPPLTSMADPSFLSEPDPRSGFSRSGLSRTVSARHAARWEDGWLLATEAMVRAGGGRQGAAPGRSASCCRDDDVAVRRYRC